MVMKEIELYTDVLLISTGVEDKALLEIISGKVEPSGLLPFQMPANMETVESHIVERNKVRTLIPNKFVDPVPDDHINGIRELTYNWKFGHSRIPL